MIQNKIWLFPGFGGSGWPFSKILGSGVVEVVCILNIINIIKLHWTFSTHYCWENFMKRIHLGEGYFSDSSFFDIFLVEITLRSEFRKSNPKINYYLLHWGESTSQTILRVWRLEVCMQYASLEQSGLMEITNTNATRIADDRNKQNGVRVSFADIEINEIFSHFGSPFTSSRKSTD